MVDHHSGEDTEGTTKNTAAPTLDKTRRSTGPASRQASSGARRRARQLARPMYQISGFGIPQPTPGTPEPEEDWGAKDWARIPAGGLIPDAFSFIAASA